MYHRHVRFHLSVGHLREDGHKLVEFIILKGDFCARLRHPVGMSVRYSILIEYGPGTQKSEKCDTIL